ncbi:MAG: NAD(+)/NADH kinase [Actinomycetota bacterium]|nr:NAD(+)/NADH kinase [Actinomycetota bacterium]
MSAIAFFLHRDKPEAAKLAWEAAEWLVGAGHSVRLPEPDASAAGLHASACSPEELTKGLDVAVSLGGDGTMLRAVDLVADADVPVLGVNLGQLGYLTEVEPAYLQTALERILAGRFSVEERMRMAVTVDAPSGAVADGSIFPALNEAVLGKTPSGQIVRLSVRVDEEWFTTYHADGLIIATPTGSTAYAWSAGGPIVSPALGALLLIPVAPHMLFDRPLVFEPTAAIRLEVVADRTAALSVDGRNVGLLEPGDAIECTEAASRARLVTFGPRRFLSILKAKFGLPHDR